MQGKRGWLSENFIHAFVYEISTINAGIVRGSNILKKNA
ncbi:hypothetical protein PYCH_11000 [Pyrococcus yayanosii CH1]|uniref:Uncharacterized protein n=1 Tax=Pyrococcus yayanosii (strain CH1 / JCM 16557) TaxID=529709 RepID=F8AEU8_PYRYC|nr:hypothetical protein PYCH_11000 [Pyrococcus yayanosii CH1]